MCGFQDGSALKPECCFSKYRFKALRRPKRTSWFPSIGSCWQLEVEYKSLNCWGFGYLSFRHTRGWRLLTGVPQMLYCSWKYPSHSSTFSSCQLHYDDGSYMFGTSYRVDGICVSCLTSPQCYCKCSAALGTDWMTPAPISPPPPLLGVCALITGQQVIITSVTQ